MAQEKTSLRLGNISSWFLATVAVTLLALIVALIPWSPLSIIGGVALLTLLPGIQLTKWLGLWQGWKHLPGLALSLGLGLVIVPLLLFWTGWLFGFSRLETFVASTLFILLTAWLNSRYPYRPTEQVSSSQPQARSDRSRFDWFWLIVLFLLTIAILLAYTEGQTELGSYPIQMGDWVKHHGVTWSLRHTGIPPTNVFFWGWRLAKAYPTITFCI